VEETIRGSLTVRNGPPKSVQSVGVNVGVSSVLTEEVGPVQSFWVCLKRTPSPLTEDLRVFLGFLDGFRSVHSACIAKLLSDLRV
jgi:hypothetical protein